MMDKKIAAHYRNGHNNTPNIMKKPYKKSLAVLQLETLAQLKAAEKYPQIPLEWLAPRKYRDDTANDLTRCILHFLNFNGWQAERVANMGRVIDNRKTFTDVTGRTRTIGSTKYIRGTGTNGTSDIHSVISGKSVKIEVKVNKDKQSRAQKKYQESVENAGGIYIIVHTFEQFLEWYNSKF